MSAQEHLPEWHTPEWSFGDRVRKARRSVHMSQPDLAKAIGVPSQRLSNWEAGLNQPRDIVKTAADVANATKVPQEWLLGLGERTRSRCTSSLLLVPALDDHQLELDFTPPSPRLSPWLSLVTY